MSTPNTVSRDAILGLISDYETALRATYPERKLPEEWEQKLAGLKRDTVFDCLRVWKWLAIYSELRRMERERPAEPVDAAAAQEAARQLLTREPVEVELGGHTVRLTARSYRASAEIARHDRRIRMLVAHLAEVGRRIQRTADRIVGSAEDERGILRRRLRRYVDLAERLETEVLRQRIALWSHALTPTGGPARDASHLPEWWDEIDAAWDSALLSGLMEAGPVRYLRLGARPESRRGEGKAGGEDLGWAALFATIETRQKLEPAALYDRDLFQLLAWSRASAPPDPLSED